jgi:hypothetical protein
MSRFLCCLALVMSAAVASAQAPPQPQREHQEMAREAGVWTATTKMWMDPSAEPEVGQATETNTMLGNMWLVSKFEGEFGGMPFTGHCQIGYDPAEKKYIGTWIDTMSPYLMTMEGEYNSADHTLTMVTKGRDFMTNEICQGKNVTKYVDDDHKTFTMYQKKGDEYNKTLEIEYTRQK